MRKILLTLCGLIFMLWANAQQNTGGYKVIPMEINTDDPEFCAVPYGAGVLLTSNRKRGFFTRVFDWKTGTTYYDLYEVPVLSGDKAQKGKALKGKVNTRFQEGPGVFNSSFSTLYFSRSSYTNGKLKRSSDGKANLKVLTAQRVGEKYKEIETLPFNSDEFSCTHPSVSRDGKTLYFASDQPGGFGGFDLYVATLDDSGKWSKPENLGRTINTPKDDVFPYIHPSGMLFFASEGHTGLGGFDLFMANQENERWRTPENMGQPINSAGDDFGIVFFKDKPSGYISSDRSGNDDIYRFEREFPINGTVVQKGTGKPLPNAQVVITNTNGKETKLTTDPNGNFTALAELNRDYKLDANAEFHDGVTSRISTKGLSPVGDLKVRVELERQFTLAGQVKTDPVGNALPGAGVRLIQTTSERKKISDEKGNYLWKLDPETDYTVVVQKDGYIPVIAEVSTKNREGSEILMQTRMKAGGATLVEGTVLDRTTQKPIPNMILRATEEISGKEVRSTVSNDDGRFWMVLDTSANYTIICSKLGYFTDREDVPAKDKMLFDTTITVHLLSQKNSEGQMVKEILYDYNKADIRVTASKDLNEVAYFLIDNPTAKVELGAHTDSRGGDSYNQKLSQSRAESAVNYILNKGVQSTRITAKGYGESTLKNKCKDGVECTDEQHQENRRCEIIIIDNK